MGYFELESHFEETVYAVFKDEFFFPKIGSEITLTDVICVDAKKFFLTNRSVISGCDYDTSQSIEGSRFKKCVKDYGFGYFDVVDIVEVFRRAACPNENIESGQLPLQIIFLSAFCSCYVKVNETGTIIRKFPSERLCCPCFLSHDDTTQGEINEEDYKTMTSEIGDRYVIVIEVFGCVL